MPSLGAIAPKLRARVAALPDRQMFWCMFESVTMLAMRRRDNDVGIPSQDLNDPDPQIMRAIALAWRSNVDSPLADLDWDTISHGWPSNGVMLDVGVHLLTPSEVEQVTILMAMPSVMPMRKWCWKRHHERTAQPIPKWVQEL